MLRNKRRFVISPIAINVFYCNDSDDFCIGGTCTNEHCYNYVLVFFLW